MAQNTVCGIASIVLVAVLSGCGKSEAPWGTVSAGVLLQGKPVAGALVLFSNKEIGLESTATTDSDGQFTMRTDRVGGLPVGDYKVAVRELPANRPAPVRGMEFPGPPPKLEASSIPERYGKIETSDLTAKVQKGENRFDLEMKP